MNTPVHLARRRRLAGAVAMLVLLLSAGCTSGPSEPAGSPPRSPSPSTSTGATSTMQPRPVPLTVRVTRVSGRLSPHARRALEANLKPVLARYLDAAFLGGRYPRSDFSKAYASFTPAVRGQARHDGWLLTNRSLGPTTTQVTPRKQAAYLSVLAPYKVAAGVTARLDLRYVADRGDRPAKAVAVKGRLLLTRRGDGWAIFAYDLSRSTRTVPAEGKG